MAEESTPRNNDPNKLPPISPRSLPSLSKPKKKKRAVNKSNGEINGSFTKSPGSDLSPDKLLTEEIFKSPSNRVLPPIQPSLLSPENVSNESQLSEKPKKKKKSEQGTVSYSEETLTENGFDEPPTNGTPRKKKKKRKKNADDREEVADEYLNTLLYDLGSIKEDVVTSPKPPADIPSSLVTPTIHSQPADILYIETNRKFKATPKSKAIIHSTEPVPVTENQFHPVGSIPQQTTLEFAINTHQIWKGLCLFIHGLTAGIGLWHIVLVTILSRKGYQEFLEIYAELALPMQSIFYTLLVICVVSVCDRYDISNITHRFLLRSLTLQTGAVSVIIYFICLILSVSVANIDDKMYLHNNNTRLFNTDKELEEDVALWKIINILRGVGAVFGWFVLSITPNADRLSESLLEVTDNVMGITVQQESVMIT